MRKIIIALLLILCLVSCGQNENKIDTETPIIDVPNSDGLFTEKDQSGEYDDELNIDLNEKNETESAANAFKITQGGEYKLSGSFNGSIVVEAPGEDSVQLIFNNSEIVSNNYAAVYVKQASKVFITLEGQNKFICNGEFVQRDENIVDAAIFSKDDITINGTGSLKIESSKHGIVGKDDVKILNCNLEVESLGHGIAAHNSIRVSKAKIMVSSMKDGFQAKDDSDATKGYIYVENSELQIDANYDAISASTTITVDCGTINITSGNSTLNSASSKGIKASENVVLMNSILSINSIDDAIHSNASLLIDSSDITIISNDDGIHSDTSIVIESGNIDIKKSYEGIEAQNITINGGEIKVNSTDDGFNAAGGNDQSAISGRPGQNAFDTDASAFVVINDGNVYVNASGDGLDSNGVLEINGGYIIVEGPTNNGNGALDYGISAKITGGVFLAIGSSGMAQGFSEATQGSILVNVSSQNANTAISIKDSNNNILFEFTSSKTFSSVVISLPELVSGGTYILSVGNTSQTINLTSNIYGSSNGGMGGGSRPGGRPW